MGIIWRSRPVKVPSCAMAAALMMALGALAAGCATTSGTTYSKAKGSEAAAAAKSKGSSNSGGSTTSPSRPSPSQPVPSPAPWPIPQSPPDYESPPPADQGGIVLFFAPKPATPPGHLLLEGLAEGSSAYIDGAFRTGPSIELESGSHDIYVQRFGYRDFEAPFDIEAGETTRLRVDYVAEPFEIKSLDVEPASFDPMDPGYLGSCELRVLVAAPGEGEAEVLDGQGRELRDLGALPFDGPSLRLRWNGRDAQGRVLPAGEYVLRVDGADRTGGKDSADARVRIVSGAFARSTTLYSGVSGALFAPDARSLEPGRLELASGTSIHLAPGGMSGLETAQAGFRVGLPSGGSVGAGGSELDFSYMGVFWQGAPGLDSYSLTAAWKLGLGGPGTGELGAEASEGEAAPRTAAALYLKGTAARFDDEDADSTVSPSWDGTTRFAGLSLGLPLEWGSGRSRAFAAPELELSDYYPNWADSGAAFEAPGWFAWAYLRMGLEATLSNCTVTASGALRSAPFGGPLELAGPYPVGLELRWHSPSSPLVLGFMLTGEIEDLSNYYFGAGLDLGWRM